MRFVFFLLLLTPALARAQTAPAEKPVVLQTGRMRPQAHGGAANRPDKAPVFPGGAAALGLFFQQHVRYPEVAQANNVSGSVLLKATVNADGTLSGLQVARSLSPECDAEALRAAAQLPPWQPATRKGVPVPVLIELPVPFGNGELLQVAK